MCRSTGFTRCAVSGAKRSAGNHTENHGVRDRMALIYLLLFASPQVLLYLYLRERFPLTARRVLTVVFVVFNIPWLIVGVRMFSGSLWSISRVPYIAPWIAWQLLGWVFCALVAVYLVGKGIWWLIVRVRGKRYAVSGTADVVPSAPLTADRGRLSRRQFLVRATYTYAAAGVGLSAYGIWNAERLPTITRRALVFPDLPPALDGLRIAHVSDVHAGIHMAEEKMAEIVALTNGLGADLIVQTGDMIDISQSYIPAYVRAFRDLHAPLGVVTVLGNHDRYTGADAVIKGVRDAGQTFVKNGVHVIEYRGAAIALVGIDDPRNWRADDPQDEDLAEALRVTPPASQAVRSARDRLVAGTVDHQVRHGSFPKGREPALCEPGHRRGRRAAAHLRAAGDRLVRVAAFWIAQSRANRPPRAIDHQPQPRVAALPFSSHDL